MKSVTILHEAAVELWDAAAYYEQRSPGLGLAFGTEVESCVDAICNFPERWPERE
jgi:hypothetical protein